MTAPDDHDQQVEALQAEVLRLRAALAAQQADAAAEHDRLTYELGHRVKNALGVVQALASQTLRGAATPQEAVEVLNNRILALARANDAILRDGWTTAEIGTVARRALQGDAAVTGPLAVEGPAVRIGASAALSFAMALHELAANARRFGAWSVPGGHVALAWTVEPEPAGERLALSWTETGGPAATAPIRRGFGLRMIEQSLKSAFGRDLALTFAPDGFGCRVTVPLADLHPAP